MQVVVNRANLASGSDVRVLATYADDISITLADQPQGSVVLSVPSTSVESTSVGMRLVENWREHDRPTVLFAEAGRRIVEAFPEHSQRNASHEMESYILTNGNDVSKWPSAAQARKSEIDRCWAYVNEVRKRCNGMIVSGMPPDPTADAQWPARITPYQPS